MTILKHGFIQQIWNISEENPQKLTRLIVTETTTQRTEHGNLRYKSYVIKEEASLCLTPSKKTITEIQEIFKQIETSAEQDIFYFFR